MEAPPNRIQLQPQPQPQPLLFSQQPNPLPPQPKRMMIRMMSQMALLLQVLQNMTVPFSALTFFSAVSRAADSGDPSVSECLGPLMPSYAAARKA